MPKIDVPLAQLNGTKVFSMLDTNSGFWQVPLAKESRLLTTFITPQSHFCFNKLPLESSVHRDTSSIVSVRYLMKFQELCVILMMFWWLGKIRKNMISISMQFLKGFKQLDLLLTEISANFHVLELCSLAMS